MEYLKSRLVDLRPAAMIPGFSKMLYNINIYMV